MTKKRIAFAAFAALILAATASAAIVHRTNSGSQLEAARAATAQYRDVDDAEDAGYAKFPDAAGIECIDLEGEGGMGVHYVNGGLVGDDVIDPSTPEALVYEPHGKKNLRLVALEYIVFADNWNQAAPPSLFARSFDYTPAPNRFGIPAFWSLHAWVFKNNPAGNVMAWNPHVSC
jgi:hypothetical protein